MQNETEVSPRFEFGRAWTALRLLLLLEPARINFGGLRKLKRL